MIVNCPGARLMGLTAEQSSVGVGVGSLAHPASRTATSGSVQQAEARVTMGRSGLRKKDGLETSKIRSHNSF
jgi:hypothetical protein